MTIIVWAVVAYLVIGALVAVVLSQTPYSDAGWLRIALLWPLFVYAFLFG